MDIMIGRHDNRDKRVVHPISPKGIAWVFNNMCLQHSVTIDYDAVKELKKQIEDDGLTVEERQEVLRPLVIDELLVDLDCFGSCNYAITDDADEFSITRLPPHWQVYNLQTAYEILKSKDY